MIYLRRCAVTIKCMYFSVVINVQAQHKATQTHIHANAPLLKVSTSLCVWGLYFMRAYIFDGIHDVLKSL